MASKEKDSAAEEADFQRRVMEKEETFRDLLSPLEDRIMSLQSILVWEEQTHSVCLFLGVNILFWLATTLRPFYVVGIIGVTVVFLDMWSNHIWPEIRVPQSPEDEDTEGWTPVHPNLLSVPEICHYFARASVNADIFVENAIIMRKQSRFKFFFSSILLLSCLATVGHYIPGIILSYFTVTALLLLPCALYNNLHLKLLEKINPVISGFEDKMKIRRHGSVRKSGRKSRHGKRKHGELPLIQDPLDTDSEEELEEFIPAHQDFQVSELLQEATQAQDSDMDSEQPGQLTPPLAPTESASREQSDTDDDDLGSLVPDLKMPSHRDNDSSMSFVPTDFSSHDLDITLQGDESDCTSPPPSIVSPDMMDTDQSQDLPSDSQTSSPPGSMLFVSAHYKQSSEEDDEVSVRGLEMPAHDSEMMADNSEGGLGAVRSVADSFINQGQSIATAVAVHHISQKMSSLVAGTFTGLSTLKDYSASAITSRKPPPPTTSEEDMVESKDTDILEAEFEFLNQEDFDEDEET